MTIEMAATDENDDRRNRLRRLDDVMAALEKVDEGHMPPLKLLFRLSELGIKDPASQSVPVLRSRVAAIQRLYASRYSEERRRSPRRTAEGSD